MINSHNPSESARLIEELKKEIARDQSEIRLQEPKLKNLEQQIAREKAVLAKMEADATHDRGHVDELKRNLASSEREFADLGRQIQQMGLGKH